MQSGDFTGLTYVPDGYYFAQSPQGDATRSYNYARLVRDAQAEVTQPDAYTAFLPLVLKSSSDTSVPDNEGYNLFAPLGDTTTYLIDETGDTVYS